MATGESYTEIVGDYNITQDEEHKLGEKSSGTVYLAERVDDYEEVAAKRVTVYGNYLKEGDFETEAHMLLRHIPLHRNIVKVHDILIKDFIEKRVMWVITKYCPLGNLSDFSYEYELSCEQKLDLIYQLSLAVRHLHECKPQSIMHLDVKPENILIAGSWFRPEVKLTDFGKASICADRRSMPMHSLAGTNCWMAPEQLPTESLLSYNKSVDTYSSALTALALLDSSQGTVMEARQGK